MANFFLSYRLNLQHVLAFLISQFFSIPCYTPDIHHISPESRIRNKNKSSDCYSHFPYFHQITSAVLPQPYVLMLLLLLLSWYYLFPFLKIYLSPKSKSSSSGSLPQSIRGKFFWNVDLYGIFFVISIFYSSSRIALLSLYDSHPTYCNFIYILSYQRSHHFRLFWNFFRLLLSLHWWIFFFCFKPIGVMISTNSLIGFAARSEACSSDSVCKESVISHCIFFFLS